MEKFSNNFKIDDIDKIILNMLQKDSRLTNKEIAAKLGLTITPVYERVRRLKHLGIIKKMITVIDPQKVGMEILTFCQVSLKEHTSISIIDFESNIKYLEEVQSCYHISGQYDYLMIVYAKDMNEYQKFLTTKLAALKNISNVQSLFVMKEIKQEYGINIL